MGVRSDVVWIEEFYSILSSKNVELNGFIDLSAMVAAAGYKFRAKYDCRVNKFEWQEVRENEKTNTGV